MSPSCPSPALDALPCGFVQVDAEDRVVLWNQRLERWTQLPREAALGRKLPALFPASRQLSALLAEVRTRGQPRVLAQQFHGWLIPVALPPGHLSGFAEMQQECHLVPLADPAGHIALSVLDVTPLVVGQQRAHALFVERTAARDRAEHSLGQLSERDAALRESEAQLRDLFDGTSDLIQSVAPDGRLLFTNRAWRETLGYTPAEVAALNIFAVIAPDCQTHCTENLQRLLLGEDIGVVQVAFLARDGRRVELEGSLTARFDDGRPTATRGIFRDVTVQRQAVAELRAAKERLDFALDAARTGTWDADVPTGKITFDARWAAMVGDEFRSTTITLRSSMTRVHPEDRAIPMDAIRRITKGPVDTYTVEHRIRLATGGWIWIVSHGRAVARDARGIATRIIGTSRDITARKQAEFELQQSRDRLESAMDAAELADWELDLTTGVFTFNDRIYALCGTTAEQEGGYQIDARRYLRDFCHPDDTPIIEAAIARGLAQPDTTTVHTVEYRTRRRDTGEARHVVSRYRIACDSTGRAVRGWGAHQDVTALKRAESTLRQLSQAVEQSPASVVITDLGGRIEYVNQRFCDLTGYTRAELIGQNPRVLKSPDARPENHRQLWDTITQGHEWEGELLNRRKDGTRFWEHARISPIRDAHGRITHYLGTKEDITARKHAEGEALRQREFLATLQQTTLDLLALRELPDVFRALVTQARALLHAPIADLLQRQEATLVLRASTVPLPVPLATPLDRASAPLSWQAVDTGELVALADYSAHAQPESRYAGLAVRATARVPIMLHGECVGLLSLSRDASGVPFTAQELAQAALLAHAAALVIHNAAVRAAALREVGERTAALRESEERFRSVFDFSPIPIALLSVPDGRIVDVNAAAARAFGYEQAEAHGKTSVELGLWAEAADREKYLRLLIEHGAASGFETAMRRKSGEIFPVLYSGNLVTISGRPYSLNIVQDITAQKRSEQAREHQLALTQATLESTADGVLVVDLAGKIVTSNRLFATMWRIPEEVLRVGDDQPVLRYALEQLAEPQQFVARVQSLYADPLAKAFDTIRFKDGRVFERYSCPHIVDGQPVGRVWSFRDLTAQVQAEQERAKLEATLRQAQKIESLGTLAGGIAHDFNNILTGVYGSLDLINDLIPPDHESRELLDLAARSAQRARDLVGQILTFGRRNEGARKPVQLTPVVEEALRLLRSTIPAMVEFRTRFAPLCPPVLADPTQIHQIVMNLCTNAWHALPERGGCITLTVTPGEITPAQAATRPLLRPGPAVCLAVEDNGSGMPPAVLARIFEPFFTTKEVGKGTGLGLAVVHGIVESHHGVIEVASTPASGTRCEIFLPAIVTESAPPPRPSARAGASGRGEHILWVDDDLAVGQVIGLNLKNLNYRVTRCTDSAAALQCFRAAPADFALVLTDLAMPGMSGASLAAQLLELRPDLPVIVLSGFVEPQQHAALVQLGVREVLRKPPVRSELADALSRHLR